MIHIAMGIITLYYLCFILYYKKLFPTKKKTVLQIVLTIITVIASYILLVAFDMQALSIPVIFIPMVWGLRFSTGMRWWQSVYGAALCVLTAHCFRAIVTGICALFLLGSFDEFFLDSQSYYIVTVFILPLAGIFFYILRRTFLPNEKLKKMLLNSRHLKYVAIYEVLASLLLIIMSYGRYLSPHVTWYIEITLAASALSLIMLVYTLYYTVQMTEFVEHQLRIRLLEEQYDRQLRHYQSYQKFTESFRAFKHDYKALIISLKTLILENKKEEAASIIDSIHDTMQKEVKVHKQYSDNLIADAILQDVANMCEENQIAFSAVSYIPETIPLSSLDIIRVLSNITSNALEACRKLPPSQRFLKITSNVSPGWIAITAQNSFDGIVRLQNGEYLTTKEDRDFHGYGMRIVREIIEKVGGFIAVTADTEKKIFTIKLHIPY